MRFCTYIHLRPDGSPFYVGKGTLARALWKKRRANPYHRNVVAKHGLKNIQVRIIKRGITEQDAFAHEIEAIACLRDFGYEITNLTDGGEGSSGWIASAETRARMSATRQGRKGIPHTEITRQRLRLVALLRDHPKHTKEVRQKISASHKGRTFTADHRANLRIAAMNRSDSHRAKLSAIARARKASDATKEKMRLSHTAKWHSDETKKKISAARVAYWLRQKGVNRV